MSGSLNEDIFGVWEGGRLWEVVNYGRWLHLEVRLYTSSPRRGGE